MGGNSRWRNSIECSVDVSKCRIRPCLNGSSMFTGRLTTSGPPSTQCASLMISIFAICASQVYGPEIQTLNVEPNDQRRGQMMGFRSSKCMIKTSSTKWMCFKTHLDIVFVYILLVSPSEPFESRHFGILNTHQTLLLNWIKRKSSLSADISRRFDPLNWWNCFTKKCFRILSLR